MCEDCNVNADDLNDVHSKGVIKDINNRAEIISPYVMGISKKFHSDDINERKRIIDLFQKDEL